MPLPSKKGPSAAANLPAGPLFAHVISKGRLPNATVDFPRYDDLGASVAKVYLRVLNQFELDTARANALRYVIEATSGSNQNLPWRPEELEENAVIAEILAVACRDPQNPEEKFFSLGVIEVRQCTVDELAMLFASYNAIREKAYPTLQEMSEEEFVLWTKVLAEGAEQFPFSRVSRPKLEAYCMWAARYCTLVHPPPGPTSSTSPASPSSEPETS